ncbi:hypothetical protein BT93_L4480 [Corymbia citriodora subsp. variegata]|uniref:FAD synthase n=1 Tax=Corymbia citriodora subsp. variegata TaxID=360336 RepID=A0A8T0CFS9_CORYI|nr:hypothetical protein BT93_L4480 [Corymbia citriodora subsp. variegata]
MSSDASAAALSPITNGTVVNLVSREADASNGHHPSLSEVCADLHNRVQRFLAARSDEKYKSSTQEQTRIALQVIQRALRDYSFEELSFSYNGGKDCLVLLVLYLAVLHTHFQQMKSVPTTIPSVYVKSPDPFPQVTDFVETSSKQYHLDLVGIATNPGTSPTLSKARSHADPPNTDNQPEKVTFRDAFEIYLKSHPQVKAIFVGTRRTDPHGGKLTHFDRTDHNWPDFMRIHPVIDWKLSEIWCFLRAEELGAVSGKGLDYCSIYDEGYTSLGGIGDTARNPRLRYIDEQGREQYHPAYMMVEDEEERRGRE